MSSQRQNTVVGIFALTGLIVLCGLVLVYGGAGTMFSSTYDVSIVFAQGVVGVQDGQSVTLYGKRVGETKTVEFIDPADIQKGVKVIVAVDSIYRLPAKAEVRVARSIMGFGRPAISIEVLDPLSKETLPIDGTAELHGQLIEILDQLVPPEMQTSLQTATDNIASLAAAARPVAENLAVLLETRTTDEVDMTEVTANLATLIERFDKTLKNINLVIGDETNMRNFQEILANARTMSERGTVVMDNLQVMSEDGKVVMRDTGVLMRKLTATVDDLSSVLRQMDAAMAKINEGQGSAALFLNDNRLYEELVLSAKRMSNALDELRQLIEEVKAGKAKIATVF